MIRKIVGFCFLILLCICAARNFIVGNEILGWVQLITVYVWDIRQEIYKLNAAARQKTLGELGEKDYNRARACMNACAGIPTERLSVDSVVLLAGEAASITDRVQQLEHQRDELVAAMETALAAWPHESRIILTKAIAKAQEGGK